MLEVLYGAWWWLMVLVCVACVVCAVLLAKSDCDLLLGLYCLLGGVRYPKALQGKVVWVTGASSGIGESLCYALAKAGAILILSARRNNELQRVLQRCKGEPVLNYYSLPKILLIRPSYPIKFSAGLKNLCPFEG